MAASPQAGPTQLDNQGLSADGVSGAVKNIRRRDSPGQIAINIDVLGIQDFRHVHHRGYGNAALVDAFRGDVRMAIDNAGNNELPRSINHLSVFRRANGLADFGDFPILNKDRAVLDVSMRDSEDGGVSNHNDAGRVRRRSRRRQREAKEKKEVAKSEVLCVDEKSS